MIRYDVVIIGAGLGGLTAGALLARAGRNVLVIERSNSVGGAASSYKVGDLFVEGSLHATSNPADPRDPKHAVLTRAGVLDAVQWVSAGNLYEVRGGPFRTPFILPDRFDAARDALTARFPNHREGIAQAFREMQTLASRVDRPAPTSASPSLSQKFKDLFGDDEAVKCALAANLSYYHDDPATLPWPVFAAAQGRYLLSGGRFIRGGSQRLSSALARAIRAAGGTVILRRVASQIAIARDNRASSVTHTAKDGSDPQTVECDYVVGNAAPAVLRQMLSGRVELLKPADTNRPPSISLFTLTIGLAEPPCTFGLSSYSTQILPDGMTRLADYAAGTRLMAQEPVGPMPPLAVVDYSAIDSGVPAPPHVLSVIGPDHVSNWQELDPDDYRYRRSRWQAALIAHLDRHYPGLAAAVTSSSFNTALSVQQYLNAPHGAVYGFAPATGGGTPGTPIPNLYLSSAYAGCGGYTGAIAAAGACAELILDGA